MKCKALCMCCGTMIAVAVALSPFAFAGEPTKPATDAAKDAVKKGTDAAKNAGKSAEDAAKKAMGGGAPEMDPAMLEGMKRWQDHMTPCEHHTHLAQWVGEWDLVSKWWMDPGVPPEENKMTASTKMVMGGRYIVEKVSGQVMMPDGTGMQPFEGMSTMGYDNHKKQYFSTWFDNMSTGLLEEWGTCDGTGKVLTTEGKGFDPFIGSERPSRSIATVVDANSRRLEMFVPGPDGKMFKQMEITYTRKK